MEPTAGLSLKPQHYREALNVSAAGFWFEVHPENYMCDGGPRHAWLEAIRERHPLSLHGVGLSLAADEDPDPRHLARLKQLADRFEPFVVSEHLAWSQRRGIYHPDLLPFPRTRAALNRICDNVGRAQDALGRTLLIENPSLYLTLKGHELSEVELLGELAQRTGCGLLIDVNNVHVSANNLGFSAENYVDSVPATAIGEIHLAGHRPDEKAGPNLLIDTHGEPVAEEVWRLYERLIARVGRRPTLIERDDNIPAFGDLAEERARASTVLQEQPSPTRAELAHV
ncbi:MAG: DUF692 domain-containing protein [Hyphomonadaceae bacterium]|nr:DUF692 domain-containing protein [Hyphomonadaceae bacterium]